MRFFFKFLIVLFSQVAGFAAFSASHPKRLYGLLHSARQAESCVETRGTT
jgi:hypothetical protein